MQYQDGPSQSSGLILVNSPADCPLMRLPVELQRIVCQYVMADWRWTKRLHIVRDYEQGDFGTGKFDSPISPARTRRLTYVPCVTRSEDKLALSMTKSWPTQHDSCRGWKAFDCDPPRFQGLYLAISLSCRHMHSEATRLLYSQHSFDLLDIPSAHRFLTQAHREQLNHIQVIWMSAVFDKQSGISANKALSSTYEVSPEMAQINFEQWAAICDVLAKMTGLQKVTMRIHRHVHSGVEQAKIVGLLKDVRVDGEFVVKISGEQ
ncbi:uncharacterized protein RSE6_14493 [Rhynchosporium secalis]|uniref:DUF7730 domain-containing protein n=1 Tax=Rhynchosporium secalis TaxID=38038 RepID=A0A1E1MVF8_RHYSE|nr:uncharacterized protein RSE6_14493 [Rhynchosporium secalis]